MLRAYLQNLRPFLQPNGTTVHLHNALGLELQPLRRAFASISQPNSTSSISKFTQRINYRSQYSNPVNKWYQSPLRTKRRSFHKTSRLRDSKSEPSKSAAQEPQGLSARLKKLSREYGWAAVGVYLSLSVLDFPFCFLLVRVVGTDRIGEIRHCLRPGVAANVTKANSNISWFRTPRRWYLSPFATGGMNTGRH
jgi:hypothetical protein